MVWRAQTVLCLPQKQCPSTLVKLIDPFLTAYPSPPLPPSIAVPLRYLEWSMHLLPGHQNSFLALNFLTWKPHPRSAQLASLVLLCLGLSMDATTICPSFWSLGDDLGEGTSPHGPSQLLAPLPSQAAWPWLLPNYGSTLGMPFCQETAIHSTSTVWVTDNFELEEKGKIFSKIM